MASLHRVTEYMCVTLCALLKAINS